MWMKEEEEAEGDGAECGKRKRMKKKNTSSFLACFRVTSCLSEICHFAAIWLKGAAVVRRGNSRLRRWSEKLVITPNFEKDASGRTTNNKRGKEAYEVGREPM